MKAQELVALVKSGEVALVQIGENKFQILRGDATESISFMTAKSAVKDLSDFFIPQGEFGMWKSGFSLQRRDAEERRIIEDSTADENAKADAEPIPEKSLDDLDDEAFAQAVIAGSGRKAKTGAPAAKKSAKTDPGMYIGERRGYPKRPGLCKSYWDLLTDIWEKEGKPLDFSISAQQIREICIVMGWSVSSFSTDYRQWRLYHNIEVRTRAPSGSRTVKTDEERAEEKEAALIDDVASIDDVEVTEV